VEGPKRVVEDLIAELKIGPPGARVRTIQIEWAPASGYFLDFQIWF
jgi:hypothetical protein